MLKATRKLAIDLLGMIGLRLDHAAWRADFVLWAAAFALGGLAYGQLFYWGGLDPKPLRVPMLMYAGLVWAVYYIGNSIMLGTTVRRRMRERWGEQRARRYYNVGLGIVFQHVGFAHGAVFETFGGTIGARHTWALFVAGLLLALIGGGIKLWSTYVTSLDIYYFNDMFTGRAQAGELIRRGPYRWFKNPMYGVGNLQGYGAALMAASWPGLIVAGIFHASLYGFYYLLERPFIRRKYAVSKT